MMNVLVTGATGLLGANVLHTLVKRGHRVAALVRKTSDLSALQGLDVEISEGDILDPGSLERATAGRDAVIHAAANTDQWPAQYNHYEAVNVTGTKNVIRACSLNKVKKVIYVSTANVFGNGNLSRPGTELSEFSAFRTNSGYVISKYLAQQWVLSEAERTGLPVIIVNPAFMLGMYDFRPSSGKIVQMGLKKRVRFCPAGGKNFIHAGDAAAGICNALTHGIPGECYLLANENMTYRKFFTMLNEMTGHSGTPFVIPRWAILLAGRAGSLFEKLGVRGIPLTLPNAKMLVLDNYYSARKAREELDLPQTPVTQAISDAIEWLQGRDPGSA